MPHDSNDGSLRHRLPANRIPDPSKGRRTEVDINETTSGNVVVISMAGRFDAYAAADAERKLDSLISGNQVNLVIDLARLDYVSSSGLRVLLTSLKKVRKQQGDIRLAALQPYVREVFDIAGFSQLFKMFDRAEEASASFKGQ